MEQGYRVINSLTDDHEEFIILFFRQFLLENGSIDLISCYGFEQLSSHNNKLWNWMILSFLFR